MIEAIFSQDPMRENVLLVYKKMSKLIWNEVSEDYIESDTEFEYYPIGEIFYDDSGYASFSGEDSGVLESEVLEGILKKLNELKGQHANE